MRAAIRLDCTGEPPGELMTKATATGLPFIGGEITAQEAAERLRR